ncbi:MAG: biotin--[acetyl-CoA-carboxylase] ligase [Actinomycetota bacterium]|nr:biotin--[acetyl-CoA-carboxylase] ligase [Actinomycetota bacterium]
MTSDLSAARIEGALQGRWGRPLRFFEQIASTNSEALQWAEEGPPEGAAVVADHQSEGRGRLGRTWLSEPGAILPLSVVLRPRLSPDRFGLLSAAAGVAAAEAIGGVSGLSCRLKWPNDVTIAGRKVAGILLESRLGAGGAPAVVCGIGTNVRWAKLPEELGGRATSLSLEGASVDRSLLAAALLHALEVVCGRLDGANGPAEVIERATALSEVLGKAVGARVGGTLVLGVASALTAAGGLVLDTSGGPRVLDAGEIESLRPA